MARVRWSTHIEHAPGRGWFVMQTVDDEPEQYPVGPFHCRENAMMAEQSLEACMFAALLAASARIADITKMAGACHRARTQARRAIR